MKVVWFPGTFGPLFRMLWFWDTTQTECQLWFSRYQQGSYFRLIFFPLSSGKLAEKSHVMLIWHLRTFSFHLCISPSCQNETIFSPSCRSKHVWETFRYISRMFFDIYGYLYIQQSTFEADQNISSKFDFLYLVLFFCSGLWREILYVYAVLQ